MKYFLFFGLLLGAACTPLTAPPLETPQPPADYSRQPAVANDPALTPSAERWWRDFSDPRLNRLEDQLFSANLSLRQALFRLDQLDAAHRIAAAGRLPTLNLNASASRNQNVNANGEYRSSATSLSLAAGYELDLWNRLKATEQAALLRSAVGRRDVQALLLSLSAQLAENYFLAVEQRAQLDLLESQLTTSKDLLEMVTERYKAGLSTAAELYQARQNLAAMEAQRPSYRTALVQAENALALLLGQAPGSVRVEAQELPRLTTTVDLGLPADLLTRRPDVAAALLELEATDKDLAAALAERLPKVSLSATLGRTTTSLAGGDYSGTIWSLVASLIQPLFDGGRLKALGDQKEALRQAQLATAEETLLSAMQEVENALVAEQNSAETLDLLDNRRAINQSNLELLRSNYLYGLTDSSDLLSSQIDHLNILSQVLTTQRQRLSQRITLVRALGGSWMAEELDEQQQQLRAERDNDDER